VARLQRGTTNHDTAHTIIINRPTSRNLSATNRMTAEKMTIR
jgi:hypothetical protein